MKLKRIEACHGKIKLVIEEEVWYSSQGLSEIWARLDVFEADIHINDYLLQSIEEAKVQALLQFLHFLDSLRGEQAAVVRIQEPILCVIPQPLQFIRRMFCNRHHVFRSGHQCFSLLPGHIATMFDLRSGPSGIFRAGILFRNVNAGYMVDSNRMDVCWICINHR